MGRFVLAHGAFVGGWYWEKLVSLLEGAGHRVEAPDLPGSGDDPTPIPEVSLRGYAERIRGVLDAQPEPVVLVGHSSGRVAFSQAAERRPDKIQMLVYVGALLLRDGETRLSASENDTESFGLGEPDDERGWIFRHTPGRRHRGRPPRRLLGRRREAGEVAFLAPGSGPARHAGLPHRRELRPDTQGGAVQPRGAQGRLGEGAHRG